MSFTAEIKTELCKLPLHSECCALSECLGIALYANRFTTGELKVQSDSIYVRKKITQLFKLTFGVDILSDELHRLVLHIDEHSDMKLILNRFGFDENSVSMGLNLAVIEGECCKLSFLRGAFLVGGYVSATQNGYHLELVTSHYNISRQVISLLLDMGFSPGILSRRGNHVIYFKDSGVIEDLLSAIGATNGAMTLMLQKVERDLRNKVNRKVNCETANLSKTVEAAAKQIEAIEKLKKNGLFNTLQKTLQYTAEVRINNPELSLSELTQLFSPPLSRPGLNNRMRKIVELAREME